MTVIGKVRLSPLDGIVVTITRVSAQLDLAIAKRGERNIVRVCRSDKRLAVKDDCPDETIKSLDATCEQLEY